MKPVYVLNPGMIYAAAFSEGEEKSMISSDAYLWVQQSLIMWLGRGLEFCPQWGREAVHFAFCE